MANSPRAPLPLFLPPPSSAAPPRGGGHRLFRHHMDAVAGDASATSPCRAFSGQKIAMSKCSFEAFLIILVGARTARRLQGAPQIGLRLPSTWSRGRSRRRVRAGDDVSAPGGDEPGHQFVHMHMRETDDADPVSPFLAAQSYSSHVISGAYHRPTRPSASRFRAPGSQKTMSGASLQHDGQRASAHPRSGGLDFPDCAARQSDNTNQNLP